MKIYEIIVVEGKNDTKQVKQAVECDTIETNGSALSEMVLLQIKKAHQRRGVIVFTDSDYPGEKIRKQITQVIPDCKHAYIPLQESISKNKKKVGIEHAAKEVIQQALMVARKMEDTVVLFTLEELIDLGFISGPGAFQKRKRLSEILHIGHSNGKQLLQKLHMFCVTREEFESACEKLRKDEIK